MSMALTINPAGSGTRTKWLADTGVFFVGVLVGALASAAVLVGAIGLLSLVVPSKWLPVAVLPPAGLAMLRELGLSVPVPYRSRQVPEWWRSVLSTRMVALAYGLVLGFGFATLFTTSAHFVVLLALPFVASPWIVLGTFGTDLDRTPSCRPTKLISWSPRLPERTGIVSGHPADAVSTARECWFFSHS